MENSRKRTQVEEQSFVAVPERLDQLHQVIARFWRACEIDDCMLFPAPWRYAFETAVVEIGTNIMRHAYINHETAMLHVRLSLYLERVVCCFADTGKKFVPPLTIPASPADHWRLLPEGGMGLRIAVNALDEFRYCRIGNKNYWYLAKRFPTES